MYRNHIVQVASVIAALFLTSSIPVAHAQDTSPKSQKPESTLVDSPALKAKSPLAGEKGKGSFGKLTLDVEFQADGKFVVRDPTQGGSVAAIGEWDEREGTVSVVTESYRYSGLLTDGAIKGRRLRRSDDSSELWYVTLPRATDKLREITAQQSRELVATHAGSDLSLSGLRTLTDEAAEALGKHRGGGLSLDGLTTLTDEAAEGLAKHQGNLSHPYRLSLNGLRTLTDKAAEELGKNGGDLQLNGLKTLNHNTARALAAFKRDRYLGGGLSLNGLTTLTDDAAEALASYSGRLSLNGLRTLTDKAAKALAQHAKDLQLDGLTTLTDKAAKALWCHCEGLSLNGLTVLRGDEGAEALAESERNPLFNFFRTADLSLNGLTALTDKAAEALAQRGGNLQLDGLMTLSDEAAEALAKHRVGLVHDRLSLNGLTTLSDKAAEALAKHQGMSLSLNGLKTLTDKAAEALAKDMTGLNDRGGTALAVARPTSTRYSTT